jgi:hypothetical protein
LDLTVSGQGLVVGCCECGDESSGSCATELVSYLKNTTGMKEILHWQNSRPFLAKFHLLHYYMSLLVSGGQEFLLNGTEMTSDNVNIFQLWIWLEFKCHVTQLYEYKCV